MRIYQQTRRRAPEENSPWRRLGIINRRLVLLAFVFISAAIPAQEPGALIISPNLVNNIDRPLRYRPEKGDFVIENGTETFNRPLYGGNTAFRVDGGDKPEFVLYLPGRGGNLRIGLRTAAGAKWLHEAAKVTTRYRPGELLYEVRDPLLGPAGLLHLTAIAAHQTEGFIVQARGENVAAGIEIIWAFGGVNGQRGLRGGDIGTERVPISEWFQLKPEFCADNVFEIKTNKFALRAKAATIVGIMPADTRLAIGDATAWSDVSALLASAASAQPVIVGRSPLVAGRPLLISLQRVAAEKTAPAYEAAELPRLLDEAEKHFASLRTRVTVDTPDEFLNAAVGALNVAADAVWDEPQGDIMHGAIAWRTRLLGWRGPYALDALGWHDRAQQHFEYWAGRQNTRPVPENFPPPDEKANLARNETGLHTNGDMSNSHYDMNLVAIDALFRHLRWTGDLNFAKKMWPVIERHLAWERRLFRREFGSEKLPLYEAYAAIWASDDLQYSGGGAMHASAYNYFHNVEAARLARLIGADPTVYQCEAQLLERGMRKYLWLADRGWFAESKDWLGLQRVHPDAALWTFYHTLDSEIPTPEEAWRMMRQVDLEIPHLPVRGPGVPPDLYTLATSNWMPYTWSINNVVMAEAAHAALGFWQGGRADEAYRILRGSLLAAMFMGISPGNVGSMNYLDVYRRESQRDFADGSGVLSRTLIEGLFGVRPDALAGELRFEPGWSAEWNHVSLQHPDVSIRFGRKGNTDSYVIGQKFSKPQALRLRLVAQLDRVAAVTVDGAAAKWHVVENSVGTPRIDIAAPAGARHEVVVTWAGAKLRHTVKNRPGPAKLSQGQMRWNQIADALGQKAPRSRHDGFSPDPKWNWVPVDLTQHFNDRVTQIFRNEYRAPRSPFVSLALPKQGLGGWAGGITATAEIDDSGLRAAASRGGGKIALPNGLTFATPGEGSAKNVVFVSQWDNYPREASVPLTGRARHIILLMAGSTNPMQSRIDNGEVVVAYADDSNDRLALTNPETWWPIEQDYFIDDFQFRLEAPLPTRVDLKTGAVRMLTAAAFKGKGGQIPGGAATVLDLPLDANRELKSLTVRALANDVVIGLMAGTLAR
jgi:hypothetical protein